MTSTLKSCPFHLMAFECPSCGSLISDFDGKVNFNREDDVHCGTCEYTAAFKKFKLCIIEDTRPSSSVEAVGDDALREAVEVWSKRLPLFDCKVEGSGDKTMKEMLELIITHALKGESK